jgi:hypothetical protein
MAIFILGSLIVFFIVIPFLLFQNHRKQAEIGPAELFKGSPDPVGKIQWESLNAPVHGTMPVNHLSLIERGNQLTGTFNAYYNEALGKYHYQGEIFLEVANGKLRGRVRAHQNSRRFFVTQVVHGPISEKGAEISFGFPDKPENPVIEVTRSPQGFQFKALQKVISNVELANQGSLEYVNGHLKGHIPQTKNWGAVNLDIHCKELSMLGFVAILLSANAILSTQKSIRS